MKKQKSKYYSEYMRERRRVQRLINRYKKSGVEINISIPKIPKRITQGSINRLSKITAEKVSRETFTPHPLTGELISVKEARKLGFTLNTLSHNISSTFDDAMRLSIGKNLTNLLSNYRDAKYAELPSYDDVIITNFLAEISQFPDVTREIILNWFNQMRNSLNDDSKIADMLEDAKQNGVMPSIKDAYHVDKVLGNLNDMFNLLDISGGEKNAILQDLDYMEEYLW